MLRTFRPLRLLLVALLVGAAAAACTPPVTPDAPGLFTTNWVTGRSKIWDLAFLPGFLPPIYTEKNTGTFYARMGDAEVARPLGTVTTFDGGFDNTGEGGLMGLAVDPGYNATSNRRVYACFSTTADNRVVRFDLDPLAAPAGRITNWTPIVTGLPHSAVHNGCRVRFQPGTGALFVSTGDGSMATAPQSATVLGGKILRIDTNGAAWPGNASGQRWYTRGHRNPQGIAFRPGSNDPYSVEHGPDVNDEVNKLVNGANSGWNPNNGAGQYTQANPMTDPSIEPANTMTPVWASGGVTVAPSGATFLSGPQWKGWDGALAVACLDGSPDVGQRLLIMKLNPAGTALTEAPTTVLNHSVRLRVAVQGPDGNLYVVTDGLNGDGAIWKVVPL
jgi:glucose/arabinose dehydrogenase